MADLRHLTLVAPRRLSEDDHRVVHFQPRRSKTGGTDKWRHPIHNRDLNILLVERFAKYERDSQEEDYRQRMIMNGLGFIVTVTLIVLGVWLTANINDQSSTPQALNGTVFVSDRHRAGPSFRAVARDATNLTASH